MDDPPPRAIPVIEYAKAAAEKLGENADIGLYHGQDSHGRHYTKVTITLSVVCLLLGGLVRGVWDVSEYSHEQADARVRLTNIEADLKARSIINDSQQKELSKASDRIVDMKGQITGLSAALDQANATLQKLSESNARLEERVIFLVGQVEGRMQPPQNKGGRK